MQYLFYTSVAAIALIVHLIINWKQLFDWRNVKSRAGALEFRHFLVCLSFFFLSDVLWGILAGLECPRLLYIDTVIFFLTMAFSIYTWTRFIVAYLEMDGRPRDRLLWTGHGLMVFLIIALVVNVFTGSFFTIDTQCVYTAGPLRQLAFALLVAFNIYGSGMTLLKLLHSEGAICRRNKMIFTFGITMAVAILIQLGDPLLPLYSLGCLFGCCLLHVFVVEDEHNEMHRKELLARDYQAQLETERATNQAKSLFFSTVSHDIRTPLNAIVGFSELLEHGVSNEDERARYISSIHSSAKVLARLVNDILDLSKMESGKLEIIEEPTDIPPLVREVIAVCEVARARKSLVLKAEIDEMPWVSVDPQRIRQLLFNLLSNAYKYTERGTITVRVQWQDGTLVLSVADTGKGISKENITRILQPFVQLADRNHRDGTGLGLAICQKLTTLMDGELNVSSEVGVGSTFTITLHNVKTAEQPPNHPDQSNHPEPFGHTEHSPARRILVVDDSSVNRAVLKAMLEKNGITDVTMTENGREALESLKEDSKFDLVLTDLWMPEMDGLELVKAIRADAKLSHLPVYLVTADVEVRSHAESDGFTGILLKPITLERLQALFSLEFFQGSYSP
ncbi:MAG: response regulator [Victivallales bacterium]|nr:response regulator [Victivallales bacterium]